MTDRPMPDQKLAEKSLLRDSEGAILVLGIVMGALLVGALWNIASIGDAAVWREHLQDGADAAAFENAVWNARGMNVVALLNILMSMVMAVLVVWRAIEIFLGALLAIIAIACIITIFFPNPLTGAACELGVDAADGITNALTKMAEKDPDVSKAVFRIIGKLQDAQKIVSSAVPLLGVAEGSASSSAAYGMVALGLSGSLTPSNGGESNFVQYRVGVGVSLPVQSDSEWKLCDKAGEFVPNQLAGVLERIAGGCSGGGGGLCKVVSALDGPIGGFAGKIAGSLPSIFCGKGGIPPVADQAIKDAATDACNAAAGKTPDPNDKDFGKYWKNNKFDKDACVKDQVKKGSTKSYTSQGAKPAKVWEYATNGNFFMQSWGISFDSPPELTRDDKALEIGDGPQSGNLVAAPTDEKGGTMGSAQAEMYWDCDDKWSGCKGNAMWQMRWRARLRRVHNPGEMLERTASTIAVTSLVGGLDKAMKKVPGKLGAKFNIPDFVQGNMWGTWWSSTYIKGGLFTWFGNNTVGAWLAASPPSRSTVIH
jgi:hypothetical protein